MLGNLGSMISNIFESNSLDNPMDESHDIHIGEPENDRLIAEQIIVDDLMESILDEVMERMSSEIEDDAQLLEAHGIINEARNIVKLNKQAKFDSAKKLAIFVIAREKGDRLYKKLSNLWKMERLIEKQLERKYGGLAVRRVKDNRKKAKAKSKVSGILGQSLSKKK